MAALRYPHYNARYTASEHLQRHADRGERIDGKCRPDNNDISEQTFRIQRGCSSPGEDWWLATVCSRQVGN